MKDLSWMKHPAMQNIDAKKLAILVDLVNEAEGKPLEQCIPALMKANTSLNANHMSFTQEEMNLIMDIITADMSPAEKQKIKNFQNMIKQMQRK